LAVIMIASYLLRSIKHTNKCRKLDFVTEKIGPGTWGRN